MGRTRIGLVVGLLLVMASVLVVGSCAAPTPSLGASLPDGASEVPLGFSLEVTAASARVDRAVLERVDAPGQTIELNKTERGARLAGPLEPDAQYRLVASAEPDRATPLPWMASSTTKLTVERIFSTVRTPLLLGADEPLLLVRNQPILLRFSEPLAQARVTADEEGVEARIASDDAHLLRVELKQPIPGDEVTLRLESLLGANGVTAADETVVVQVPDAVEVRGVSGSPGPEVAIIPETRVLLELSSPVRSLRYRWNDQTVVWSGLPTTDVELPITLASDERQQLTVLDADGVDGGWIDEARTYDLLGAAPLQLAAFWPENGAAGIPPNGDPTFRFSEPVTDHAAAEAAISFDPPVPGRFEWLAPNRVHFVPAGAFPRESEVHVNVEGGAQGVRGASGSFMTESYAFAFTTGKEKRIDVSLGRQVLTLYENDAPVWTSAVATGVRGAETPLGTYKVQYKMRQARFRGVNPNGSRYDIPDVNWVLAFFGDYTIHGAYWRSAFGTPGSNGCISLTDANARYVWLWAEEGTPIVIRG